MDDEEQKLQVLFGRRVRALREDRGYSQESFAQIVGKHRTYVGNIERGKHSPTLGTIASLARALSVPMEKLVQGLDKDA